MKEVDKNAEVPWRMLLHLRPERGKGENGITVISKEQKPQSRGLPPSPDAL